MTRQNSIHESFSQPAGHSLALLQIRYPQSGDHALVYRALCAALVGRGGEVDWPTFTSDDWSLFEQMAYGERVNHLLCAAWTDGLWPLAVPRPIRLRLVAHFALAQVAQRALFQELADRVLAALAPAVEPVVLLKGGALAPMLYPSLALRPMSDVDILVRPEQLAQAVRRLEALGYGESAPAMGTAESPVTGYHVRRTCQSPVPLTVEVHQSVAAATDGANMAWFWTQLEPMALCGSDGAVRACHMLSPTANLLHLSAHLMLHHGEAQAALVQFYDLHLLVDRWGERVNWQEAVCHADEMEWTPALWAAMQGCADRLGTRWPEGSLAALTRRASVRTAHMVQERAQPQATTLAALVWLALKSLSWPARAQWLGELVFPRPAYVRWRYRPNPAWLWPLCYFVRWGRGLCHAWRTLMLMARGANAGRRSHIKSG